MIKNYFYSITVLLFLISFSASAQETKAQSRNQDASIEGLNFYPNPVSNGKIYITSKLSLDKDITIFDVLGKKSVANNFKLKRIEYCCIIARCLHH